MPGKKKKLKPVKKYQTISDKPIECKNCGRKFEGKFCPDCGQSIKEFEKPFSFLIVDLAGNIFAFDTRFWKSLLNLLIRPGYLTYDYLRGHRARYMPPFRFYIFISFVFFVLLSSFVKKNFDYKDNIQTKIDSALTANIHEQQLDTSNTAGRDTMEVIIPEIMPDGFLITDASKEKEIKIIQAFKAINNNPTLYMNRFLKFISWSMFLLMPVFALLLWLFFIKYRKYYYGHFIFSVNLHAFSFIIFILVLIVKLILPDRSLHPENYILILIPIYMIIAACQFYKSKWWKIALKWIAINFIYVFIMALSVGFSFYFWFRSEFL